jgi:uncharacterized membrane protein HdeD (DUF308 family)
MKQFFKKYLWLFEFLGVAIILAVGIFAFVKEGVFLYISGLALIIFGLLRIIPLVKTTKDNLLKIIYSVEVAFNVIAGVLLIVEGGKDDYSESLMRYLVGAVFYLRGVLYFFGTVIRKEPTDYPKFVTHIVLITLGPIIIVTNLFTAEKPARVVLIIAVISAIFIALSGVKNYKNYRYEMLAKEETKRIKKQEPVAEDKIEDPQPAKEEIIIPEEEKQDELNA